MGHAIRYLSCSGSQNHRHAFRAKLASLITAVALAFPQLVAAADQDRQPGAEPSATRRAQIDFLKGRFGVDERQAETQLDIEASARKAIEATQVEDPSGFAGAWIDHEKGGRVTVAVTNGASRSLALARVAPLAGMVDVIEVRHSVAELDRAQTYVAEQLERRRKESGGNPEEEPFQSSVDARQNAVVARVLGGSDLERAARELARGDVVPGGVPVIVQVEKERFGIYSEACPVDGCNPIRGGLRIASPNGGSCSTGFIGRHSGCDLVFVAMTAGHCHNPADSRWFHNIALLGSEGSAHPAVNGNDAMAIQINDPGYWRPTNWVRFGGDGFIAYNEQVSITSKASPSAQLVGGLVCRAGQYSSECGALTSHNVNGFGQALLPGCPGDSGGAWFGLPGVAYGLHHGGSDNSACPGPDSEHSYFTWITTAENSVGADILTSPVAW